jgi:hypothetical protein
MEISFQPTIVCVNRYVVALRDQIGRAARPNFSNTVFEFSF